MLPFKNMRFSRPNSNVFSSSTRSTSRVNRSSHFQHQDLFPKKRGSSGPGHISEPDGPFQPFQPVFRSLSSPRILRTPIKVNIATKDSNTEIVVPRKDAASAARGRHPNNSELLSGSRDERRSVVGQRADRISQQDLAIESDAKTMFPAKKTVAKL